MERSLVFAGIVLTALLVPFAAPQDPQPAKPAVDPAPTGTIAVELGARTIEPGTMVDVQVRREREGDPENYRAKLISPLGDWVVLDTGGSRVAINREQIVVISTVGR